MASHALPPASPLLSPGRHLYRAVPQSPILGFRSAVHGIAAAGCPRASPTIVPRHTKSTSDLAQGRGGRYDPSRLAAGSQQQQRMASPAPAPAVGNPVNSVAQQVHPTPSAAMAARAISPHGHAGLHPVYAMTQSPGRVTPPPPWQKSKSAATPSEPVKPIESRYAYVGESASFAPAVAGAMHQAPHPFTAGKPDPSHAALRPWAMGAGPGALVQGQMSARQVSGGHAMPSTPTSQSLVVSTSSAANLLRQRSSSRHSARAEASSPRATVHRNLSLHSANNAMQQVSGTKLGGSMVLPLTNADGHEAQVAHVRDSLLQHIQCVQREITRLQAARQKHQPQSVVQQPRPHPVQVLKPGLSMDEAVRRLQRWWREAAKKSNAGKQRQLSRPPLHHSAARIQRCWRIYWWRRRFVDVSVKQVGWLGSLAWLQEQNLLYGTELADAEDARWWMEQRAGAPLDHEVDPWGAVKLRDHLDRMWYGRTSEEMAQEERQQRLLLQQEQLLLKQRQQQAKQQLLPRQEQKDSIQRHSQSMQDSGSFQGEAAGRLRGRSSMSGLPVGCAPAASARTSPLSTDRSAGRGRSQRGFSATLPKASKSASASLSPRRDLRLARGEITSKAASMQGVPAPRNFLSPPSTHRSLGSSQASQPSLAQSNFAPPQRTQSPLSSHRGQMPAFTTSAQASPVAAIAASVAGAGVGRLSISGLPGAAAANVRMQQVAQAPIRSCQSAAASVTSHGSAQMPLMHRAPQSMTARR
eukprot:TRINITY_DN31610_c0_g1_i1.p1 TRINITY_DN31610_c0_g1~~TRINITY_DN31610_c0_g1_i1.p1  ORF type:complete len:752 (-),score=128.49 TRINITY_DN31610_c0_g1_i1:62-2317(-)